MNIRVISPWVAWLLRSAPLQLLHQHLAAPPQSVTDLPEGAAAAQRAVTVLRRHNAESASTGDIKETSRLSCLITAVSSLSDT